MEDANPAIKLSQEQAELDLLLNEGTRFQVEKSSLLRFFGASHRQFLIKAAYLSTLFSLAKEFLAMDFSYEKIRQDGQIEAQRLVVDHAYRCAKVVAISVLRKPLPIRLFSGMLAYYFASHLTPRQLLELVVLIEKLGNVSDFILSTKLMSAKRVTKPGAQTTVEEQPATPEIPQD